jgi:hypothetical protein
MKTTLCKGRFLYKYIYLMYLAYYKFKHIEPVYIYVTLNHFIFYLVEEFFFSDDYRNIV